MIDTTWAALWHDRYRTAVDAPTEDVPLTAVIEQQYRHRSVRRFLDADVSDAEIRAVVGAAQSASVSSNLQVWSVIAVRDPDRRHRIATAIGNRGFIEAASVLLVFVADFARATHVVRAKGEPTESIDYLDNTLVGFVDAGIAGQNAILAAESLGLGGVFLGSIRNAPLAVADVLGLPEYVFPVCGIAIGHPDPEDTAGIKPRLPQSAVLHWDAYDVDAWETAADVYEERIAEYYDEQEQHGYSWKATLANRLRSVEGLHGRDAIRAQLAQQGLPSN